jgi:hypothetical protein
MQVLCVAAASACITLTSCSSARTSPAAVPSTGCPSPEKLQLIVKSPDGLELQQAALCPSELRLIGHALRRISIVDVDTSTQTVAVAGESLTRDHVFLLHGTRGDRVNRDPSYVGEYNPAFDQHGELFYVALAKSERFAILRYDLGSGRSFQVLSTDRELYVPFRLGTCMAVPVASLSHAQSSAIFLCPTHRPRTAILPVANVRSGFDAGSRIVLLAFSQSGPRGFSCDRHFSTCLPTPAGWRPVVRVANGVLASNGAGQVAMLQGAALQTIRILRGTAAIVGGASD